jgi:hypothetical protein
VESPAKSAHPQSGGHDPDDRRRSSVVSSHPETNKTGSVTNDYGNTPLPPESSDGNKPASGP